MKTISIGIHVHAEPDQLQATIASLRVNTAHSFQLLLLPDGPDAPTRRALAALGDIPQLGTDEPQGAPACFNRLAAATDADILVLLESGAIVGPGWLDHALAALDADPRNGLVGPSTNRSWNEQAAFPRATHQLGDVARTAADALQRYGQTNRTLEPLYSLADFCYIVRRAVIASIGAADPAYGLGPCWEMDYNIRAARSGWRGVWACAAYVARSPCTARRQREEAIRFDASRRLYQDRFCALHLRAERTGYEPHCRGDACEHFAPPEHIRLALPLQSLAAQRHEPVSITANPPHEAQITSPAPDLPLVSCIMPTRNRAAFVLQSLRYFQQQEYPARELIIIDDGSDNLLAQLPADPRICYHRVPYGMSIGAKRNLACNIAKGVFIAQWDDDDWYAPQRLSTQIAPLLSGQATITGLRAGIFFDLPRWEFWRCTPALHQRLFVEDIHGGTLTYRRDVWQQLAHYPDRSLAEDALFLRQALAAGARLCRITDDDLFVYLRHTANSWAFTCGHYLDPSGWLRVGEPAYLATDRPFYAAQSPAAPTIPLVSTGSKAALVSCIMPTANRRSFVPRAIRYFLGQDYPHKELVIVDDGEDSIADLVPAHPHIRYTRMHGRQSVGAKRNQACELAQGTIIAHWDDDDWHAPHRLSYQVQALLDGQADLCGINQMFFYDLHQRQAWRYRYPSNWQPWLSGSTLCYTRTFWAANRFAHINIGEDARFVATARAERTIVLPDPSFHVGIIHGQNVSPKYTNGACWQPYATNEIEQLIGSDW